MNVFTRQLIGLALRFPKIDQYVFDRLAYKDRYLFCRYRKPILKGQVGNDLIALRVASDRPFMVSRLGACELECLRFFHLQRLCRQQPWSDELRYKMKNNAGFFPVDDDSLDRFSEFFLEQIQATDIMGVWYNLQEDLICNRYSPDVALVELDCLEPFRFSSPWSVALRGKRVLVVHPFAASIARQYREKRPLLFADPSVLPEFELVTVKAVQSIAGSKVSFTSWFDAYDHMCGQIAATEFDIAIIGAGAYGLPLAAYVKGLGKRAVHMGGVTQILFGVKGRRWEEGYAETTAKLFNEHWTKPSAAEIPQGHEQVEGGCYW